MELNKNFRLVPTAPQHVEARGFNGKGPVARLRMGPPPAPVPGVRPLAEADLPVVDELCRRLYRVSRRNEVAAALRYGFGPLVREREGRIAGYLIPGMLGHGV